MKHIKQVVLVTLAVAFVAALLWDTYRSSTETPYDDAIKRVEELTEEYNRAVE